MDFERALLPLLYSFIQQQQLDLTLFALSLDVFVISPTVVSQFLGLSRQPLFWLAFSFSLFFYFTKPMQSVVAHFTGRAGLNDYSTQLEEAPDPPSEPIAFGGFSDIYRVKLRNGNELAVKCLRGTQGQHKQVKVGPSALSIHIAIHWTLQTANSSGAERLVAAAS